MFGAPGWSELLIVAIIGLLLFGKRLPEVARSLGKGIVEFKKGVRGIEDEVNTSVYRPEPSRPAPRTDVEEVTAPKFEPPTAPPAERPRHTRRRWLDRRESRPAKVSGAGAQNP